jgi:tetratricopeptide (TPR) repeat protein
MPRRRPTVREHNILGVFYSRRLYDLAIAELAQVLRYLPDSATVHYNMGGALFGKGCLAKAEVEFRTALALEPGHLEAGYFLGLTLRELGRPAEALQEMERVLRACSQDPFHRLRREAREQIAILRDQLGSVWVGEGER